MFSNNGSIFDGLPWPTSLGNGCNCNASSVTARCKGQLLWSAPLPKREARAIIVGKDGCCYVATDSDLVAVEPDGKTRWIIKSNHLIGKPILLTSGQLIVVEDGGSLLVARDQFTGRVLWSLPINTWVEVQPGVTFNGSILLNAYQSDQRSYLQLISLDGKLLWSAPLEHILTHPPLVLDRLILTSSKSYIQAFSREGLSLWLANQNGFQILDSGVIYPLSSNSITRTLEHQSDIIYTPIMSLQKHQVLAGLLWQTGHGLFIFDVHNHTVEPCTLTQFYSLLPGRPLAILSHPNRGLCFAVVGGQGNTMLINLEGSLVWSMQTHLEPISLIGDASGNVFMVHSPNTSVWDKYKNYYQMEEQCYVKGLDSDGKLLFTWIASGPISYPLAIGKYGEIFCVSEGRLWAIG